VFDGDGEYLEDLVARIDAPSLDSICITFFNHQDFDIVELAQFIRRATRFHAVNEAHVFFNNSGVQVRSHEPTKTLDEEFGFRIICDAVNWRYSSMEEVFSSFVRSIHMVEHLYIHGSRDLLSEWQDKFGDTQWLEVLYPFTAVKNLYVIREFAQCIAPALEELVEEMVMDVLPALECLFLEELQEELLQSRPVQESIRNFVALRRLSGQPITVSLWEKECNGLGLELWGVDDW
jgi:hypothetical protein